MMSCTLAPRPLAGVCPISPSTTRVTAVHPCAILLTTLTRRPPTRVEPAPRASRVGRSLEGCDPLSSIEFGAVGARSDVACVAEHDPCCRTQGLRGARGYAPRPRSSSTDRRRIIAAPPFNTHAPAGAPELLSTRTRRMGVYRSTLACAMAVHAGTRALRAARVHVSTPRRQLTVRAKVSPSPDPQPNSTWAG